MSDSRMIVRGEASGTPAGDFMGVPQGGKSSKLMSIDITPSKSGKIDLAPTCREGCDRRRSGSYS